MHTLSLELCSQVSTSRESLDDHAQLAGQSFGHGLTADLAASTAPIMPEEPAFQMPLSKVNHDVMHMTEMF